MQAMQRGEGRLWLIQRGEGRADDVERVGHDVRNGLDRGCVDVVVDDVDKMPARVRRPRQYNK